jgi:hypothetical protein
VANKNGDLTFSDYSCHALTTNLLVPRVIQTEGITF